MKITIEVEGCSVPGCTKPRSGLNGHHGHCDEHYHMWLASPECEAAAKAWKDAEKAFADRVSGAAAKYTLDGEPTTWREFLEANQHELPSDEIQRAAQLAPGESIMVGGGAGAGFVFARVA
jgi:hypothetical protein